MSLVYVFAASKQEGQPNVLFCAYFPLVQHDGRLMTAQANSEDALMLTLLRPIPAYLAAEQAEDAEHLSLCFAEDGLLHDEGRDYRGRDAILRWKQAADENYKYTMQPLSAHKRGNEVTVRARLTGDFPGSPVEENLLFKISNDKIASLEIRS